MSDCESTSTQQWLLLGRPAAHLRGSEHGSFWCIVTGLLLDLAKLGTLLKGASGEAMVTCSDPGSSSRRATWVARMDLELTPEVYQCLEATVGEWCQLEVACSSKYDGKFLVRGHERGVITLTEGDGSSLVNRDVLVALRNQRCKVRFEATLVSHRLRVTGTVDALSAYADYFEGGALQTKECGLSLVPLSHLTMLSSGEGFYNTALNDQQKQAVIEILQHRRPHTLYLVVGPPGTGKTATLDEVVLQLARNHVEDTPLDALIYYVLPTNLGVKATADRLLKIGFKPDEVIALYSETEHLRGTNLATGMSQRASRVNHLPSSCVVIGTPISIARIGLTLGESNPPPLLLVLDEAAYMKISEAFAVMTCNGEPVQTILAGDRKQLRPRSFSKVSESLHGKFSIFDLAAESGYFEDDGMRPKVGLGVMLRENYRAHENLVKGVSTLFYQGLMFPAPVSAISHSLMLLRHGLETLGLDADRNPLRWVNADGVMERDVLTSSLFNLEEADVVSSVVSSLFRCIPPNQITVLAPYRKQVVVLREKLPSTVTTFTVDEVIGQERPVVVVSLVRSERSGPDAKNYGVGFLKEPNRVNVLISRAKEIVILVGSRNHFHNSRISFWRILTTHSEPLPSQF